MRGMWNAENSSHCGPIDNLARSRSPSLNLDGRVILDLVWGFA
jgi:hypothetical protein